MVCLIENYVERIYHLPGIIYQVTVKMCIYTLIRALITKLIDI